MYDMKSDRRTFLKQASLAAVGSLIWQSCAPSSRPPNILFITTDYMRGKDMPGPQAPFVKMPHLKKSSRKMQQIYRVMWQPVLFLSLIHI